MAETPLPPKIAFHYIKSQHFRVIHVDGAIGGVTPRLTIQTALYSERVPIPQRQVFKITPQGQLGEQIPEEAISRDGLVREVEAELLLDLNAARSLATWLSEQVSIAEKQAAQLAKGDKT